MPVSDLQPSVDLERQLLWRLTKMDRASFHQRIIETSDFRSAERCKSPIAEPANSRWLTAVDVPKGDAIEHWARQ
jgi:hypothetical protein